MLRPQPSSPYSPQLIPSVDGPAKRDDAPPAHVLTSYNYDNVIGLSLILLSLAMMERNSTWSYISAKITSVKKKSGTLQLQSVFFTISIQLHCLISRAFLNLVLFFTAESHFTEKKSCSQQIIVHFFPLFQLVFLFLCTLSNFGLIFFAHFYFMHLNVASWQPQSFSFATCAFFH